MTLETLLTQYGLPAIALGCVIEGDGVAFLGGVLAHRGLFAFEAAALAAAAGAFASDLSWFFVGRFAAERPFVARLLEGAAARRVLGMVQRRPTGAVLGFRFIYGMRIVAPVAIAASGVSAGRFAALNALAVLLWAHLMTALGFGLGLGVERLIGQLPFGAHLLLVIGVFGAGVVGWLVYRAHRRNAAAG